LLELGLAWRILSVGLSKGLHKQLARIGTLLKRIVALSWMERVVRRESSRDGFWVVRGRWRRGRTTRGW
jgi:hypothetical protein